MTEIYSNPQYLAYPHLRRKTMTTLANTFLVEMDDEPLKEMAKSFGQINRDLKLGKVLQMREVQERPDISAEELEAVIVGEDSLETELSYLTTATGFFVGFAWITLLRDLATLVARVGAASGAQEISYAGEALCVFVFGPVLTCVLIRGLSRHRRAAPSEVARLDGSSVAGHAWRELLLRIGLSPSSSLPGSPHGAPTHWTEVEVGEMQDYELEGDDRLPPRFSIDDSPRR